MLGSIEKSSGLDIFSTGNLDKLDRNIYNLDRNIYSLDRKGLESSRRGRIGHLVVWSLYSAVESGVESAFASAFESSPFVPFNHLSIA